MSANDAQIVRTPPGAPRLRVGFRDLQCIGGAPPRDHAPTRVEIGPSNEAACPRCGVLFVYDAALAPAPPPVAPEATKAPRETTTEPVASDVAPPAAPTVRGVAASFETEESFRHAFERLNALRLGSVESFTPMALEGSGETSPLPAVILAGGLIGAALGFAMQAYANIFAYPLDIGGRPEFSWPSFVPIAFEIGALCAVATALVGAFVAAGLFKYHDAIDELDIMRRATQDRWLLVLHASGAEDLAKARSALAESGAGELAEIA